MSVHKPWPGLIEAYRDRLPGTENWTPVTLLEGGTPLIHAKRLSELTGCTVHLKVEGLNPTGSFKDRGMTVAVNNDAITREHDGTTYYFCGEHCANNFMKAPQLFLEN